MKRDYFSESMKLEILSPIEPGEETTNHHFNIQCKLCSNVFVATPKSKKQNFGRWGAAGCPLCTRSANDDPSKERVVEALKDMGYELLDPYINNKTKIRLRTMCCKRVFKAIPNNVLVVGAPQVYKVLVVGKACTGCHNK